MLSLLRKYQKAIFLVVTVIVSLSMLFFGTFSSNRGDQGPQVDKTVVFKTASGKSVTRDQMTKMVNFLTEKYLIEDRDGGLPLRLHDGVFERDFLASGWASLIAEQFPDLIRADLKDKLAKEKKFKLYKHSSMPMISVDQVWKQSLPSLSEAYARFKQQLNLDPSSKVAFDSRTNLYLVSQQLPPTLLKRILLYQQNIYQPEEPDYALPATDLSLFSYHNAQDWFGEKFMQFTKSPISAL